MTNEDLRRKILEELDWDPSLDAAAIGVAVRGSIVTLTGHVRTLAEKLAAEQAVKRVHGVRGIAEEIEVTGGGVGTSDDEIARRAVMVLDWDAQVPKGSVMIKVEHGWVTLSGEVGWQFQRLAAAQVIQRLEGTKGITNDIVLKERSDQANHQSIEAAIRRRLPPKKSNVSIAVEKGKVTIAGKVRSWAEREAIEHAAWAAPGVSEVAPLLIHDPDPVGRTTENWAFAAFGLAIAAIMAFYWLKDILHF
ncbi:MAG: BON domain-containing protein [Bauldia sp.]